MKKSDGTCDMCGHYVSIRQKAHIVDEGSKKGTNLLMLCPSCHIIFDTQLKPKIFKALLESGVHNLPDSWSVSIYDQAAKASQRSLSEKKKKNKKRVKEGINKH